LAKRLSIFVPLRVCKYADIMPSSSSKVGKKNNYFCAMHSSQVIEIILV
jgi:hypothetical protein